MTRVLFVCTGNICRSPLGAAALRARALEQGLELEADSAATHGFHVGEEADPRAIEAGRRRGYDLTAHRARQLVAADFSRCSLVLAMDRKNLQRLRELAPAGGGGRIALLLKFAPEAGVDDVPDPYYGGVEAFERALDLIDSAVEGLVRRLER